MISISHTVYSTPEAIIASHLTQSPSARGKPRFSGDRATRLANNDSGCRILINNAG